jgi:D-hexose-6-phosphate mutarotase
VIQSETDRVYLNTKGAIELEDPSLHRRIDVVKENSFTTVVWGEQLKSRWILHTLKAAV